MDLESVKQKLDLQRPTDFKFGDWTSRKMVAKGKKAAEKLVDKLGKIEGVEKIEAAGGGYINFYLTKEVLVRQAEKVNYEIEFRNSLQKYGRGKTVVIDYSAPNIAKPFGIGHLRSTDIGQAIYNLYKMLGWRCIGDNHLGDWGTQFGKLLAAIKRFKIKDSKLKIEELEKLYIKFHQLAENEEKLNDEAREWFKKLEEGDKEARKIWQRIVTVSTEEFMRIYDILGVKFDYCLGESFYEDKIEAVVAELKKKKLVKKSQGAWVVEFDRMPAAMVVKSDGASTYLARDLATIKYRVKRWNPDLIVYEVGADQSLYFRQLFEIGERLGWIKKEKLVHVAHGLIRWKGAKFSTRRGNTIHLEEVINRARKEAERVAKKSRVNKKMSHQEWQKMIEAAAVGAIKFADLKTEPKREVIFDWKKVMSLEGNSGPYLQYSLARATSVLDKSKIREQKSLDIIPPKWEEVEIKLLKLLGRFEEKIKEAADKFSPAVVADYLLNLARTFNEFYAKYRIIGNKQEVKRIFLTRGAASVLKMGLELLGIETIEKM